MHQSANDGTVPVFPEINGTPLTVNAVMNSKYVGHFLLSTAAAPYDTSVLYSHVRIKRVRNILKPKLSFK